MGTNEIARIAEAHGVLLLLQFGSSVTGKVHRRSDVDLAALLNRSRISLSERTALLHDLQGQFPDREVDLAILNHADPLLLKKIMESCRLLYGESRRLHFLKIYAFKRYQDHGKYFEMERRFIAKRLAAVTPDG